MYGKMPKFRHIKDYDLCMKAWSEHLSKGVPEYELDRAEYVCRKCGHNVQRGYRYGQNDKISAHYLFLIAYHAYGKLEKSSDSVPECVIYWAECVCRKCGSLARGS
jgi:hypothetical protein